MSDEEDLFITQSRTSVTQNDSSSSANCGVLSACGSTSLERPYFELFSDISDTELVSTCEKAERICEQPTLEFSDISEDELTATCEAAATATDSVPSATSSRFGVPKSDEEIMSFGHKRFADSTMTKIRWADKSFKDWQTHRNRLADDRNISHIFTELEDMTCDELNYSVSRFICEVKKLDGSDYPPDTLYSFVICIQLYLDTLDKCYKLLTDDSFAQIRNTVDNVMKINSKTCKQKKQAQIITPEEEDVLWSKGCLGSDKPSQLLDTMVYLIGINFALRGGQEHRNLCRGPFSQFQICESQHGRYLMYTEQTSKTNSGGLKHRRLDNKRVVAYANVDSPGRCIVNLFAKYCSLCPSSSKTDSFYLRPLDKLFREDLWYCDQPLGRHKLACVVSRLCKTAGLTGYRTNHSLRASAASRLYEAGVDEQLICEVTGHRSTAVRNYKRTTESQKKAVSSVIQGSTETATSGVRSGVVALDNEKLNITINVNVH